MKEVRAYIRCDEVNQVVENLRTAGAPGVSIVEIYPLRYGYETNPFEAYTAGVVDRYRHLALVKLELVRTAAQLDSLVDVIGDQCQNGIGGDGLIFMSDVVEAVRIRDRARRTDPSSRISRLLLRRPDLLRAAGARQESG